MIVENKSTVSSITKSISVGFLFALVSPALNSVMLRYALSLVLD